MLHRTITVTLPDETRGYRVEVTGKPCGPSRGFDTRDEAWRYVEQYTAEAHNVAFTLIVKTHQEACS